MKNNYVDTTERRHKAQTSRSHLHASKEETENKMLERERREQQKKIALLKEDKEKLKVMLS